MRLIEFSLQITSCWLVSFLIFNSISVSRSLLPIFVVTFQTIIYLVWNSLVVPFAICSFARSPAHLIVLDLIYYLFLHPCTLLFGHQSLASFDQSTDWFFSKFRLTISSSSIIHSILSSLVSSFVFFLLLYQFSFFIGCSLTWKSNPILHAPCLLFYTFQQRLPLDDFS